MIAMTRRVFVTPLVVLVLVSMMSDVRAARVPAGGSLPAAPPPRQTGPKHDNPDEERRMRTGRRAAAGLRRNASGEVAAAAAAARRISIAAAGATATAVAARAAARFVGAEVDPGALRPRRAGDVGVGCPRRGASIEREGVRAER